MFIIGVLIALGLLVVVHEAGHFIAAKLCGVTVEKFSIGFGPRLFGFTKGGTSFLVSLIPLGGYVKMKGDEPEDGHTYESGDFLGQKWWKRVIIVFAGPIANLVLGLFLFTLSFGIGRTMEDHEPVIGPVSSAYESILSTEDRILTLNGNLVEYWSQLPQFTNTEEPNKIDLIRDEMRIEITLPMLEKSFWWEEVKPFVPAVIGSVAPGMPAYRVGIKDGDQVIRVDGNEVDDWYVMRSLIADHPNDSVDLTIGRGSEEIELTVPLEVNLLGDEAQKMIGITQSMPVQVYLQYGLWDSLKYGAYSTVGFIAMNYYALGKVISRPLAAKEHIGGPVMIVTMSHQTTKLGWGAIIAFVASISLILMIMNLLPIPVLDGGHIFFFTLEGIFGKPLPLKAQVVIQQIGFMMLILLMLFAFYNDISKLIYRNLALRLQQTPVEMTE